MTYSEAKKYLIKPVATATDIPRFSEKQKEFDAYTLALVAFEQLETIQRIIDVPNYIMQEDVIKYQMICQIMRGDNDWVIKM